MAVVKGTTWEIEVGAKPDPNRYDGFDRKESYRVFADTHSKALAILTKYVRDFNPDHIVKSERGGITVIADFPDRLKGRAV